MDAKDPSQLGDGDGRGAQHDREGPAGRRADTAHAQPEFLRQIEASQREKAARTPAERKIDSQLLNEMARGRAGPAASVTEVATSWGLAEGRIGGDRDFRTYLLPANPQAAGANVTVTYLRANSAPIVKFYVVSGTARHTIDVNSDVPELGDSLFGARIDVTNGVGIMVERSMSGTPTASSGPAAPTPPPRSCPDDRTIARFRASLLLKGARDIETGSAAGAARAAWRPRRDRGLARSGAAQALVGNVSSGNLNPAGSPDRSLRSACRSNGTWPISVPGG